MVSFQRIHSALDDQEEMALEARMVAMVALTTILEAIPRRENLTLLTLHLTLTLKNLITKILTHQHLVTIDVHHFLELTTEPI